MPQASSPQVELSGRWHGLGFSSCSSLCRRSARPLNGAEVLIAALNRSSVTDAAGGFRLSKLPAGAHRVLIRAIGFEPLEYDAVVRAGDSTQIRVTMTLSSVRLPTVTVEERGRPMRPALQALAERKRIGLGVNAKDVVH